MDERAPRRGCEQPPPRDAEVAVVDRQAAGDPTAQRSGREGGAGAAQRRRAGEVSEHRRGEPPVHLVQRRDVRRRRDQDERLDALRVVHGEPGADGAAEAVADDGGAPDAATVERGQRGLRVAGEVGCSAGAVPSRPVDRDRRRPAPDRRHHAVPVACAARLAVQQQDRRQLAGRGARRAVRARIVSDRLTVAADVAVLAAGDHHDRVILPRRCAAVGASWRRRGRLHRPERGGSSRPRT